MFTYFFNSISLRTIYSILTAFLMVIVLSPRMIRRMKKRSLGQSVRNDGPETHLKKEGVPTMGGLVILIAIVVTSLLWTKPWVRQVYISLFVLLCMGLLGFVDDLMMLRRKNHTGLSAKSKLFWQGLVGLACGLYLVSTPYLNGFESFINVPILGKVDLGFFYVPFVILVIMGSSNAVNLTDGLDGLACGILSIVGLAYAGISYITSHEVFSMHLNIFHIPGAGELTIFCGAILGACLGFLWYNSYPAQIFMGDTGSLSLGAALGTVAVLTKSEIVLVVIGGIFVVEALSVIIQVTYFKMWGKRVFKMSPLHHHFELKGWAEPKVVFRFWVITFVLALLGLSVFGMNTIFRQ